MYRSTRNALLVISVAAGAIPAASHSQVSTEQAEANRARWQSHIVAIDGSLTPSEIPYGEKMLMVFKVLEARQSRAGIEAFRSDTRARYGGSAADLDALAEAVIQDKSFVNTVRQQETRELTALCTELSADGAVLPATQLAERFSAVETRRLKALESHYAAVMQGLGPQMRASIQSEIDTKVVPTMTWGTIDHIGLANTFPGPYSRFMKANCVRWSANQND